MKVYRTTLSEVKKLIKEGENRPIGKDTDPYWNEPSENPENRSTEDPDPKDIESAMYEYADEIMSELKSRILSNIKDFSRDYDVDPSYIAGILYDAYSETPNELDAIQKTFMEAYEEEWG